MRYILYKITATSLGPDVIVWSTARTVIMGKLSLPGEEGMEVAYKCKKEKYSELRAACTEAGWRATTYLGEVDSRGK